MTEEEKGSDIKRLELTAMRSKVKAYAGIVRINSSDMEDAGFEQGQQIEVSGEGREGKGLIVNVNGDKFAPKGKAVIRPKDMEKMGLDEGDALILQSYKKYADKIKEGVKEKYDKVKEKIKERKDEDEEEEVE